jgi:thiosulfate/3-mercaptopyruvate sulfurtransferase
MPHDDSKTLVSTEWLAAHLKDPDLRVIDATYYIPGDHQNAQEEYNEKHIPGARFFDIDDICDQRSNLPHMVPSVVKFISRMRAMGIGDGHQVVVYDTHGMMSAARVWWLFKLMGQENIACLNGGFPKWEDEDREIEDMPPIARDRHMMVRRQNHLIKDVTQVSSASKLGTHEILDARSNGRFIGEEDEPRPGLRLGHIPGSRNLHFGSLLNTDMTMKTLEDLRAVFDATGMDWSKPVITTCGSGVTAAVLSLALERLGKTDHSLYDGSWSEWGLFPTLPVETGDSTC